MDNNIVTWLLAASPIIIFLVMMLGFKWGGSRTGAFTWLFTVVIAWVFFGANFHLIAYSYIKAFFLSFDVLLIVWSALFLYMLTEQAGTVEIIGNWLSNLTTNKAIQGIFLGWLFPSFLQGMGGFGVPVAVAAPLLVSTGFSPIQALVMSSVGHSWGVTFGSMSSSFRALMVVSGLEGEVLAPATAIVLGIAVIFCGFLVIYIADGWRGMKTAWHFALIMGVILAVGQYYLATNDLWIIAVTLPALIALFINYFLTRIKERKSQSTGKTDSNLFIALVPYIILVSIILLVNLVPIIKNSLDPFNISFDFPEIQTNFGDLTPAEPGRALKLLNHPGEIIFLCGLFTYLIFRLKGFLKQKDFLAIVKKTAKRSTNTTISVFTMVGIAMIMSHTQMTSVLAQGISRVFNQDLYPIAAPFIGALGAFITGSNSNSNVLFSGLQMETAGILGLNIPIILAAQTAGGALGSMMAPAKVILGCATVGLGSEEGKVIGKILVYGISLVFIVGISTYFLIIFSK